MQIQTAALTMMFPFCLLLFTLRSVDSFKFYSHNGHFSCPSWSLCVKKSNFRHKIDYSHDNHLFDDDLLQILRCEISTSTKRRRRSRGWRNSWKKTTGSHHRLPFWMAIMIITFRPFAVGVSISIRWMSPCVRVCVLWCLRRAFFPLKSLIMTINSRTEQSSSQTAFQIRG